LVLLKNFLFQEQLVGAFDQFLDLKKSLIEFLLLLLVLLAEIRVHYALFVSDQSS
jgi:hypothetical protein